MLCQKLLAYIQSFPSIQWSDGHGLLSHNLTYGIEQYKQPAVRVNIVSSSWLGLHEAYKDTIYSYIATWS